MRREERLGGASEEFGRTFTGKAKGSVSRALDGEGMRQRVDAAQRKAKPGEKMTQKEIIILQSVSSHPPAAACYALRRTERDGSTGGGER